MKKTLLLQLSMFFLVIASLHSFSMPQMPANHHIQKAAVSGDELHELTAGKHGDEKAKSLSNSLGLRAEFILLLILAAASAQVYILNRRKEHLKAFMLAVFYHSSYFDKAHVLKP
ncbi:hypothetical protein P9D34_19925 [Bacillus swezeyi]|uniref:Uncharacterized protein n=1 Tax=Bacillus swezeyi TaxID=1925020 RepID=A0A1R1QB92_9BACI|nr:hypothetical protein [Bacillus swezeyi]MEC1262646.1 hypothetical protein [Bacillus swezeyi]MED2929037.1 hypothetical protein [Bacillus swezeyi]MED2944353.1 hypothetical protein [Bacillus swezeyi]MED2964559.1 hypothetical protein [Bacillus swezeyi]MED2976665.1 hypothetical protein [Bacillus swezeyi]